MLSEDVIGFLIEKGEVIFFELKDKVLEKLVGYCKEIKVEFEM